MFKIKLVSWAIFFLALENTINTRTETVTAENAFTSEHIVPLALFWLSVMQLVMVHRHARKMKAQQVTQSPPAQTPPPPLRPYPKGEE